MQRSGQPPGCMLEPKKQAFCWKGVYLGVLGVQLDSFASICQGAAEVLQMYVGSCSVCIVDSIGGVQCYGLCVALNRFRVLMICATQQKFEPDNHTGRDKRSA